MAWSYQGDGTAGPALETWRMERPLGSPLVGPVEAGGAVPVVLLVGSLACTVPVASVEIGDWSGVVASELPPQWATGFVLCWRRFVLSPGAEGVPEADEALVLREGLPLDVISLPALALAVGVSLDGEAASELLRVRAHAVAMVRGRTVTAVPAAAFVAAVTCLVGYFLERPQQAGAAWGSSGAAQAIADHVALVD